MNIITELPPLGRITKESIVAIDIEIFGMTGRLHRPSGTFACIQICVDDDVYIEQDIEDVQAAWDRATVADTLILQNAMFDIAHLRRWIDIKERVLWDTMIVEKLLWGGYYALGGFGLDDMARRYLDIDMNKETVHDFADATELSPAMLQYSALDAWVTKEIYHAQQKEIAERKYDMKAYWEADQPAIWSWLDFNPCKVRTERWLEMSDGFLERGTAIQDELGINVNSSKQVIQFLAETTNIKVTSTNAKILTPHIKDVPVVGKILKARGLRKLSSTYGANWVRKFVEEDDLVYANWNVTGTETGRLSCSKPNLLNIPAKKEPEFRELFIPVRDKLIVADISQQEPRALAFLSGDKNLTKAFIDGEDIHSYVAQAIYDNPTIGKGDPRRADGKMVNLATTYGMTAKELAKRMGITERKAEVFLRAYFKRFPDVENYIHRQRLWAERRGYVDTVLGRRVWVNLYNYQWKNNAINSPIQGSSADSAKMWINRYRELCKENGIDFTVILPVYDEVVVDVWDKDVKLSTKLLRQSLEETSNYLFPDIPFALDVEVGTSWGCKNAKEKEENEG